MGSLFRGYSNKIMTVRNKKENTYVPLSRCKNKISSLYRLHKNKRPFNCSLTCHSFWQIWHFTFSLHHSSYIHVHPFIMGHKLLKAAKILLIFMGNERLFCLLIHINSFPSTKKYQKKLFMITLRNAAAIQEPPLPPPAILLISAVGLASWTCFEKCLKRGIRQTLSPVFIPACNKINKDSNFEFSLRNLIRNQFKFYRTMKSMSER